MYFDGSLKLEGTGAGVLLISPMGEQLNYVLQIFWKVSNNDTEYEALLHGLRLEFHWASSGYWFTATPQWSSTKSTSLGIATWRTWTPTTWKSASVDG
jgi:ribonuclease HI